MKGFGPETSFAQSMKTSGKFGIIKVSAGATTLFKEWNPNTDDSLYGKTIDLVREAEKTRPTRIAGVLWMQVFRFDADERDSIRPYDGLIRRSEHETGALLWIYRRSPRGAKPELAREWLDPATPKERVEQMLLHQGEQTETFEWFKVDRAVGTVRNQGPELIRPIADSIL